MLPAKFILLPVRLKLKFFWIFFLFTFSFAVVSQQVQFRHYGTEQGLCGRYVNTLNEDNDGFIWIGTGSGICRFDGLTFRSDFLPDSLNESLFLSSYHDSTGNLWFGSNDGLVIKINKTEVKVINVRSVTTGPVNGFAEDINGNMVVSTQNNGLLKISQTDGNSLFHLPIDQELIYSLTKTVEGRLLIGTNKGLFLYSFPQGNQPPELIRQITEIPEVAVKVLLLGEKGEVYAGTTGKGLLRIKTSTEPYMFTVKLITEGTELNEKNIEALFEDGQSRLWVATQRSGLIKILNPETEKQPVQFEIFDRENGLETNGTKDVFQDFEGNIWVGTAGKGLFMLMDEAFSFLSFNPYKPGNSIYAISADSDHYYFGGDYGIEEVLQNGLKPTSLIGTNQGLPEDRINTLYSDTSGVLWIGTDRNGVYRKSKGSAKVRPFFVSKNDLERSVQFITGYDSKLWVATKNGIFFFNLLNGDKKHFTTNTQLPYNSISHLFLDGHHNLWFATTANDLYYISPEFKLIKANYPSPQQRIEFKSLILDKNKDVWAATYGNGVLHFTHDSVFAINSRSGLKSDYCYSIQIDADENIWVGHRQGYSLISEKKKLIQTFGKEKGIMGDANQNAVFLDPKGILFLGTSDGVVIFNPSKEKKNKVPPKIVLNALKMNNRPMAISERIVLPYARYEMKIDFTGLSFKNPERVNYRYKLENYDNDWSVPGTSRNAVYKRLEDGIYEFKVIAFNEEYTPSEKPVGFLLIIRKPVWKTWWFISLIILVLVGVVVLIIKIRERNHKKLEAYLQSELTARTKEVVEQKDEIELKNKEITDSINYAQRIQASILPSLQKLKNNFPESFVYYQPRDIVSGDFYWWEQITEDRFLVVCADSTGHGVPGAFMSMIGSTLIKDIVSRDKNIKPSELLGALDDEITRSLNQNLEVHTSNDGMDIIVCEFNMKKNHMIFASAMRPIIMFHKGEQYYIRGNRSSIGGEVYMEKVFEDQEYHLAKGDVVYMFSDGYPDQFGGPNGKKLKMLRLKNLLDDIHNKNMTEQFRHIKQNFEIWKGDFDQVDDVLFMGIKI